MGKTKFRSVILASALAWGCSSSNGGGSTTGAGGSSHGTGGTTASGGSVGTGGSSTGTGGSSSGNGGSATGSGGTGTGSGGSTGSGGTISGNGGSTGGASGGAGGRATTGNGGSAGRGMAGGSGTGTGGSATGSGGAAGGSASGAVTVQLSQTEQVIEGFGINDNWTSGLGSKASSLFSNSGTGLGLTILRTGMSDAGSFYNSDESSTISAFKSAAGADAKVIGSVWSPPANCKTPNTINPSDSDGRDGGHLMSSCYDSWSTTIANFASSNGFYAMSIGNEPDFNSCGSSDPCNGAYPTTLMTASEMVAWVKVAGPKLQAKKVKVIAPEASEWIHQWSNVSAGPDVNGKESSDPLKCGCFPDKNTNSCASTCTSGGGYDYGHWMYKDTAAWAAFDILGVHEYDSQQAFPWPSDVNGGKPDHEIWQTEMSGVKWWPEQGPSSDINNGIAVAGWIHSALVDGQASAWLWWWYQASGTDDNEGLLLKNGTDTKRHYTLGNYSKFVRPGYKRVDVTGSVPSGVLLSAYTGPDGTVVVVAINKNTAAVSVPIAIAGGTGTGPAMMTPYVTSSADNVAAKTAVAVSGGSFTAMLGASTVTTFVGK